MKRIWAVATVAAIVAVVPGGNASAAVDRTLKVVPGQRLDWNGASVQGMTNYYYWDPVGAGTVGPLEARKCTKDRTSYCEQVLVEFSNPLTAAEIEEGLTEKRYATTIWLGGFAAPQGPVNDFDLLVYESDASGTRGQLIASDGNLQNTTMELVTFDVMTTVDQPSTYVLIDIVYYQVVNGRYVGHLTF